MIGECALPAARGARSEPDKLAGGVGFGPRVMMTRAALAATGLVTPGSIVRHRDARDAERRDASDDRREELRQSRPGDLSAGRLGGAHARRRVAAVLAQSRPLHAIADAGRAHRACRGRRRRRQRRAGFRRAQAHAVRDPEGAGRDQARASSRSRWRRCWRRRLSPFSSVSRVGAAHSLGGGGGACARSPTCPFRAALDARGALFGALYGLLVTLIFALVPLGRAHETPVAALLRDDTAQR